MYINLCTYLPLEFQMKSFKLTVNRDFIYNFLIFYFYFVRKFQWGKQFFTNQKKKIVTSICRGKFIALTINIKKSCHKKGYHRIKNFISRSFWITI